MIAIQILIQDNRDQCFAVVFGLFPVSKKVIWKGQSDIWGFKNQGENFMTTDLDLDWTGNLLYKYIT